MKPISLCALLLMSVPAFAQPETFGIATYQAPSGWQKQTMEFAVGFSTVDQVLGTWVQVAIYNSVPSSGNPATDFSGEWKALVKPETYAGAVEPSPTTTTIDGWTYNSGKSTFQWQGKSGHTELTNISGYGVMVSVHVGTNSDKYSAQIDRFVKSIQLKKPAQQVQSTPAQNTTVSNATIAAPITVTGALGTQGITRSTTNFDDGWVAQPFADYVRVTKGSVTVLLHYAMAIDDPMGAADNIATVLWDRLMMSRYRVSNLKAFQNAQFEYNKVYFLEGDAVEISGGKNCYVGLRALNNNGSVRGVEIIAPSQAEFQREFPDQSKIEAMVNYNKFAISPDDIVGHWEESTSTGVDMYNTTTGNYAGMNMSAAANSFTIKGEGNYESHHSGAFGMVGSSKFYDQKYNGKYTMTPWEITMTKRFEGKTDTFTCQFEAVRGGRMLYLRDKVAAGIDYHLVRVK